MLSQAGSTQSSQASSSQSSLVDSTLSLAESELSQAGSSQSSLEDSALPQSDISQAGSSQSSLEDSALSQSDISQASSSQSSLVDSTLSPAESVLSQAGSSKSSPEDSALSQSDISQAGSTQSSQAGSSQPSPEDSALQAESAVLPQAVRCSARLRAFQASHIPQAGNSSRQAGTTPRVDSIISQPDSTVPQVASSQASTSQEARSLPSRHNTLQGSSPLEEPNPKWVINLSSKPLTPAQRSVLAKGPNFVVTPRHPPNLEYITAIEASCSKQSQQDAEELRANINWILRASHPQNLT